MGADGKGVVTVEGKDGNPVWRMNAGIYAPGWKPSKECKVEEGYPKKEKEGKTILRFSLIPPDQDGEVNVTVSVTVAGEAVDFQYGFEVPKPLKLNAIFVTTKFPVEASAGKTLVLGGRDIPLPAGEYKQGEKTLFFGSVEHVTYPVPDVRIELTTDPDTHCIVHDSREWGGKDFEVRLNLLPGGENQDVAGGAKFEKHVRLSVTGLTSCIVGGE
jgi:hypothetical protein